ncbi:MAG: pentapeptide repeat-containing protein [Olleya sp.]
MFKDSIFESTDFTEANLTESKFENCNIKVAVFESSDLEKADFTTAYYYSINPERNKIKAAKFSKYQIEGLLDSYKIHIS